MLKARLAIDAPKLRLRQGSRIRQQHPYGNRQQNLIWELEQEDPLTEATKLKIAEMKKLCRKVERKYGKRNLGWDDFEWGY